MKIALCAVVLAASTLAGCAGDGYRFGHHGGGRYWHDGRNWDRREKVCDVRPNGRKVCTWRYY
jgi:hypothetical protein